MTVTPAVPRDVGAMLRLMELLAAEHSRLDPYFLPGDDWLPSLEMMFLERLSRRDHLLLVAREEGPPIGMVTASLQPSPVFRLRPRAVIENLIVRPEYRRQGVAQALVETATAWCVERRVVYTELMVAVDNAPARSFWEQRGFEPIMLRMQQRSGGNGDGNGR
ncbi:MAG: GNAT family N-acetyltransferase [Armatimonadetes bacterium]|nr:GNAT family N-acetyltransferase [Armatimonadota bacterium]